MPVVVCQSMNVRVECIDCHSDNVFVFGTGGKIVFCICRECRRIFVPGERGKDESTGTQQTT